MEHSSLYDLICCLEYGTNIHISIVFIDNFGNYKTKLPTEHVIHSKPFCDFMKYEPEGLAKCVKCRNAALKKALAEKRPYGGLCFNGIYEYCHPVIEKDAAVAVIFLGNILSQSELDCSDPRKQFSETFERNFTEEKCRQFCSVIENQIKLLIYEYSGMETLYDPIITNIKNYIAESLCYDISVRQIASVFNYNEKYIGKLFKKHTGKTIKEYLNDKRLKNAEQLLKNTTLTISEISARTGFNNVTYFNRLFKTHFQMSPTKYRAIEKDTAHTRRLRKA